MQLTKTTVDNKTINVEVIDVCYIPLDRGAVVQLNWTYAGQHGTANNAVVDEHGKAVFNWPITLQPKKKKVEGPLMLVLCLVHLRKDSLTHVIDKVSVILAGDETASGRFGVASSKRIIFNLKLFTPEHSPEPASIFSRECSRSQESQSPQMDQLQLQMIQTTAELRMLRRSSFEIREQLDELKRMVSDSSSTSSELRPFTAMARQHPESFPQEDALRRREAALCESIVDTSPNKPCCLIS